MSPAPPPAGCTAPHFVLSAATLRSDAIATLAPAGTRRCRRVGGCSCDASNSVQYACLLSDPLHAYVYLAVVLRSYFCPSVETMCLHSPSRTAPVMVPRFTTLSGLALITVQFIKEPNNIIESSQIDPNQR